MSYAPGYPQPQGSFPPPQGPPPQGPPRSPPNDAGTGAQRITGAYDGVQFKIDHRDSNTMLYMRLQPGYEVLAKPGTMVSMDATVQIKGKMNFSFKKLLTGGELSFAHFFGPGEVVLAPETWGDVAAIQLDGRAPWFFGKHAFLAATTGIQMTTKSQSFGKALFSGHGLFTAQAVGVGMLFVHGMGAIICRSLQPGEQWIVNNDHLVAWNCQYNVERIQAGGLLSTLQTDEGAVCRFTGPGQVYIQSRSTDQLISFIAERLPERSS
ncbi:hypothetical protein POSPLADRAFT_1038546 [Postia placenta MAD-698-R-SB12]|uniref:Altered inheritance of mitochondria protein 24, mitochondrial n=1 Tax=Postia placenta MAD-698-R-SB12 TaxID=670580 RepID=A0A1X6NC64_9APHY|nr:hypothetical protein POSPLADRAFT_1038546 [Postia placenta MAD-698-R-SB12]OSX66225.1 hypothetical protein POSPLADRAFT_1038546 [Postia placenta MAD-698-R-SB12]